MSTNKELAGKVALGGVRGIVPKLWQAIKIEIPIGYQDEMGFHMEVKPAEQTSRAVAVVSFAPRRRLALLHPAHNLPLGWQPDCALRSQHNKLFFAYLMRRRET
jgi:hypothetical protein